MAEAAAQEIRVNQTSRGLAVIITNDYNGAKHTVLGGTHLDGERMKEAFEVLKFDVCWKKNVNLNDIQQLWREISSLKFEMVKHYKCMAFVFSGHGEPDREGRDGKLIMQDDKKIDIYDNFVSPVLAGNAKEIGDILKIFFIDACRGDEQTETVDVPTSQGATGKGSPSNATSRKGCYKIEFQTVPSEGNCLVAYSTLPGCRSNDYGKADGSPWLKILARNLTTNDENIQTVLTDVNGELQAYYREHDDKPWVEFQQPEVVGRINKRLYLLRDGHEESKYKKLKDLNWSA